MPVVYVYNRATNRVERYIRNLSDPMPYSLGRTLTVAEFRSNSISNILWTDRRTIESWNAFRRGWGRPIYIGYAFKRIWEGGHSAQSQHYAGIALDVGQTLPYYQREALRAFARNSGVWSYVEPQSLAPRWVHVDDRYGIPACARGGFPPQRQGSKGPYVFVLQDALIALGFTSSGLDGVFGPRTRNAVIAFQRREGLVPDGIVGCNTWVRLTTEANGIGLTATVIR